MSIFSSILSGISGASKIVARHAADPDSRALVANIASSAFDGFISLNSNLSPRETGGPVVKTGPTAGRNRSRNKNGAWRAKRSDAGTKRS